MKEVWYNIPEFSSYIISNYGEIMNLRTNQMMSITKTNHGHLKVSLLSDDGQRHTRSISLLVAQACINQENPICDQVIVLDGDLTNVRADNLAWRPRWFSWKYSQQLKAYLPDHYYNLSVVNKNTGAEYPDIYTAGVTEGLLFDDIWRSTFSHAPVYPNRHVFEVNQRV